MNDTDPIQPPAAAVFVIRLWPEWSSADSLRWRGRIQHLQSDHDLAFTRLDEMTAFIRSFGFLPGDQGVNLSKESG